jgi:mannose-6-phosphate isomerase-like protein (cupin superfamily)
MKAKSTNVWNAKPVKYSDVLKYEDFVIERKDASIIRFDDPINEGEEATWAYKNLVTKDLGADVYVAWIYIKPGGGHDYHAHSGWEIIYILEGSLQSTYRSKDDKDVKSILNPGDVIFIPEGTPHSVWNTTDKPCCFIVIKSPPYFLEDLPLDPEISEIRLFKK